MPHAESARVHPTAVVSPEAELAGDVGIGPYAVLEGKVRLGPGCVIRPHAHLIGPLTAGSGNLVCSGAVLGERPQHLKYGGEPTGVEIGDNNIFREHVTVHRATTASWTTRIGSGNFFMAGSHVAHDCRVGHQCIFANGALLGGHCEVANNVFLSGNSVVHQFVRIGRLALLSGVAGTTKDIPPFAIQQGIDNIVGVNVVGMRRAGLSNTQIDAVRRAFHVLFFARQPLRNAAEQVEQELGGVDVVAELLRFIRESKRGVARMRLHDRKEAA